MNCMNDNNTQMVAFIIALFISINTTNELANTPSIKRHNRSKSIP